MIGEGGSGGAIAIAIGNRVIMLEHAIYSVISPEGAASILWRDTAKAQDAASSMKITAQDMVRFGIVDSVVPEPTGGAHRDPAAAIAAAGEAIAKALGSCAASTGRPSRDCGARNFPPSGATSADRVAVSTGGFCHNLAAIGPVGRPSPPGRSRDAQLTGHNTGKFNEIYRSL